MVLKKNKMTTNVQFIDATEEFVKVTNNNRLTQENIDRIVNVFASKEEIEHFSHNATTQEIEENVFNLSVSTYVEKPDLREKIDIEKLNADLKEIVSREQILREAIDEIVRKIA